MRVVLFLLLVPFLQCVSSVGTETYYIQKVDHFSTSTATYKQRYYVSNTYFKGPGHPIFVIMGGEGAIPPSVGLFYPFVYETLASNFSALVVEPEHRFYGESLPFGADSYTRDNLRLLTPQQALADAATFIRDMQKQYNCGFRGTDAYCPVVTFGGSYPGFLSYMMRLRYPAVVDIAYAASAPVLFYAQKVDQFSYYRVITASAERAVAGCADKVRAAMTLLMASDVDEIVSQLNICTPLPPYLLADTSVFLSELAMVIQVQFANMNMANYPPSTNTTQTDLAKACQKFVSLPPWDALRDLLAMLASDNQLTGARDHSNARSPTQRMLARLLGTSASSKASSGIASSSSGSCFNFNTQIPSGDNGTVSCGDWSGCGGGLDGESWDYETCGFLVETIGTNGVSDMFPARNWTMDWLTRHCRDRFDVMPQPSTLVEEWGFDDPASLNTTHVIFTNGLNDGWSVGGFSCDVSPLLKVYNMPNGAHHSDLSHNPPGPSDTYDVTATRAAAQLTITTWLSELQHTAHKL